MHILVLVLALSQQMMAFGPSGVPHIFADKASCEKQLVASKAAIEAADPFDEPYALKCVTPEEFKALAE